MMEITFQGKTVLVTGAGQGIGRAICKQLAACGAHVIALSRTQSHLDSLLAEEKTNIRTVCVDLTDWEETRRVVSQLGPVDALVNNAASGHIAPFMEATPEDFDRLYNSNVKQVINVSQIVVKGMIARGRGGSIVNISSQAGLAALNGHTLYCGTKGALEMTSRVMALELGPHNIRVNTVNPTVVMTEMGREFWSEPNRAGQMLSKIPLGRFAEVQEVVDAVVFLLSDKASMCNGVYLPIDGGFVGC